MCVYLSVFPAGLCVYCVCPMMKVRRCWIPRNWGHKLCAAMRVLGVNREPENTEPLTFALP